MINTEVGLDAGCSPVSLVVLLYTSSCLLTGKNFAIANTYEKYLKSLEIDYLY